MAYMEMRKKLFPNTFYHPQALVPPDFNASLYHLTTLPIRLYQSGDGTSLPHRSDRAPRTPYSLKALSLLTPVITGL